MSLTLLKSESEQSFNCHPLRSFKEHAQPSDPRRSIRSLLGIQKLWSFSAGYLTWATIFPVHGQKRKASAERRGKENRSPQETETWGLLEGDWKDACQLSPSCFTSFPLSCEQFTPALLPVLLLCCSEDSIKAKYKYLYWHCDGRM